MLAHRSRSAVWRSLSVSASRTLPASPCPDFVGEPSRPVVHSRVPSPASVAFKEEWGKLQDPSHMFFAADYNASVGNYIAEHADGAGTKNMLLDMFGQIGSIGIGYNNPALLQVGLVHRSTRCVTALHSSVVVCVNGVSAGCAVSRVGHRADQPSVAGAHAARRVGDTAADDVHACCACWL
jgi:4-aminobutyrate aminotransferase/(S)-3-amino-2-methylpropionate transaminase